MHKEETKAILLDNLPAEERGVLQKQLLLPETRVRMLLVCPPSGQSLKSVCFKMDMSDFSSEKSECLKFSAKNEAMIKSLLRI